MYHLRCPIVVTLESPFLMHGLAATAFGVDARQLVDRDGHALIPGDQIKGLLRQALTDLHAHCPGLVSKATLTTLLGDASPSHQQTADGGYDEPVRAWLHATDLKGPRIRDPQTGAPTERTVATRVEIDDALGSAEEGHIQFVELPAPYGTLCTFRGNVSFDCDRADGAPALGLLRKALALIPAIGALKTAGFGRVDAAQIEAPEKILPLAPATPAIALPTTPATARLAFTVRFDQPILVDSRRIENNVFWSAEVIPGAVFKGAVAERLKRAGLKGWEDALAKTVFSHAFPAADTAPTATGKHALPLSLLVAEPAQTEEKRVADALLWEDTAPPLLNGKTPAFQPDWKEDDKQAALDALRKADRPWPQVELVRSLRTRTAIDAETGSAKQHALFSYQAIEPTGLVWRFTLDAGLLDPGDLAAFAQFVAILEQGIPGIGKTGAFATPDCAPMVETPPQAAPVSGHADLWAVTLDTPALMLDPATAAGAVASAPLYNTFWQEISDGALTLKSHFAQERLAGGYLSTRFRLYGPNRYFPFLLTEPGSVFLLRGTTSAAQALLEDWLRLGLPQPTWLQKRQATWRTCPFLRENGYGAIRLNTIDHVTLKI